MAEELNVKIKADSSKLTSELDKVEKSLNKLNGKSKTIEIKTNSAQIIKNLNKLKATLDKVTGKSNISVNLSTGQTLNRLKAIDDRLKSIRKNSDIKINITENIKTKGKLTSTNRGTTTVTPINSRDTTITTYPKEKYKTLQQQARQAALLAEQNYNSTDFESYKNDFMDRMQTLVNFKKALGDISVGQEKGIYSNMARSLEQTSPVYDTLINKVKDLNKEQTLFNSLIKESPVKKSGLGLNKTTSANEYSALQQEAIDAARAFNSASINNTGIDSAKRKYEEALQSLLAFKSARNSLSYSAQGSIYKSIAPQIQRDSSAYKILKEKIDSVKQATRELNASNKLSTESRSRTTSSLSSYILTSGARAFRSPTNAVEELGKGLSVMSGAGGAISKAAGAAGAAVTVIFAFASAFYLLGSAVSSSVGILRTFGETLYTVLQPGIDTFNTTSTGVLSLTAALQTMGNINGRSVTQAEAHTASLNLMSQALIRAQQSAFNYKEVVDALQGTLPLALGHGLNAQQALDVSTGVAGVAKLTRLPSNQVLQETRDLLQGTITARTSQVANALGITNEDLAKYKDNSDELFNFLQERFSQYSRTLKDYSNTVPGSIEQLQETIGIAGQEIVKSFGATVVGIAQYITGSLGQVTDAEGRYLDSNNELHNALGENINDDTKAWDEFNNSMMHFELSDNLKAFLAMLWDIADYIAKCADEVYDWAEANGYIDEQQGIFENLGNLIKLLIGFTVNATMFMVEFGQTIVSQGISAYNGLLPLISVLRTIIKLQLLAISGLVTYSGLTDKLIHGDFKGASEYVNTDIKKFNEEVPDKIVDAFTGLKPIDKNDIFSTGTSKGEGRFSQFLANIKNGSGKYVSDEEFLNKYGTGTTPSSIEGTRKENEKVKEKEQKAAIKESQEVLKENQARLKEILSDALDKLKDELETNEVAFKEGFKSMQDYYNEKAKLEQEESQARLAEAQEEKLAIQSSKFNNDYDKLKALHDVDRNIAKYSKELSKASDTVAYVGKTMQEYTNNMSAIGLMIEGVSNGKNTNLTASQAEAKNVELQVQTALENWGTTNNAPVDYIDAAINAGLKYSVDPKLILSIMKNESGFNQDVTSSAGAIGLMQLMPSTAESLGVNPYDAIENIYGGASYIAQMLETFGGDIEKAIAAYNAGSQAVKDYNGVPPYKETQNYVNNVLDTLNNGLSNVQDLVPVMDDLRDALQNNVQATGTLGEKIANEAEYVNNSYENKGADERQWRAVESAFASNLNYANNPTFDAQCASFVSDIMARVGVALDSANVDELQAQAGDAFKSVASGYTPQKGDIIIWGHHTGIYMGGDDYIARDSGAGVNRGSMSAREGDFGGLVGYISSASLPEASNYLVNLNTQSPNKESSEIKSKINDSILELYKTNSETFSEVLGISLTMQLAQVKAEYDKKIADARSNPVMQDLLKKQKIGKINELTSNYLMKVIDFNLDRMEETMSDRAEEIAYGKIDSSEIVGKYFGYFSKAVDSTSKMAWQTVANQIGSLEDEFVTAQKGGYVQQAETIRKKLRSVIDKLYSYFDNIISAIDKKYETISSTFENIPMTNLQKEHGEKEIKSYKNAEELKIRQEAETEGLKVYWEQKDAIDKLNVSLSKRTEGTDEYNTLAGKISIKTEELVEQQKKLETNHSAMIINEQLAKTPSLLRDIHTTSKQALEDGLVTFLTDGINEAESLTDALKNLASTFLKTMQEMFAKEMVLNLMNRWFPPKDTSGTNASVEGLSNRLSFEKPYQYQSSALQNSIFGASNYTQYSFNQANPSTFQLPPLNPYSTYNYKSIGYDLGNNINNVASTTNNAAIEASKATELATIEQVNSGMTALSTTVSEMTTLLQTGFTTLNNAAMSASTALQSMQLQQPFSGSVQAKASGGLISGAGTESSDSIPSMLSNGEFVVKASSVRKYGANFLNAVNGGYFSGIHVRKFANGGYVASTGTENTARGMASFGQSIGSNTSFTGNYNLILATNQQEAMDAYMKSPAGQRVMLSFNKNHASVINRLGR